MSYARKFLWNMHELTSLELTVWLAIPSLVVVLLPDPPSTADDDDDDL